MVEALADAVRPDQRHLRRRLRDAGDELVFLERHVALELQPRLRRPAMRDRGAASLCNRNLPAPQRRAAFDALLVGVHRCLALASKPSTAAPKLSWKFSRRISPSLMTSRPTLSCSFTASRTASSSIATQLRGDRACPRRSGTRLLHGSRAATGCRPRRCGSYRRSLIVSLPFYFVERESCTKAPGVKGSLALCYCNAVMPKLMHGRDANGLLPFLLGRIEDHLADAGRGSRPSRAPAPPATAADAVDQRLELALGRGLPGSSVDVLRRLAGRADDGDVVLVEPVDVERHDAAAMAARRDQPAAPRQRMRTPWETARDRRCSRTPR